MEFRQVDVLVPGTKYKILHYNSNEFIGKYNERHNGMALFLNVYGCGFRKTVLFSTIVNRFYVPIFQAERIQSAMEHRAVNIILRKVIGDESFTW